MHCKFHSHFLFSQIKIKKNKIDSIQVLKTNFDAHFHDHHQGLIIVVEDIYFTIPLDHDVGDDDHHIGLVFLECGVAKLNPQQNLQHEYLNSHMLKTLYPLLFTSSSPLEERRTHNSQRHFRKKFKQCVFSH
jgi:hypothetical protein